MIVIGIKDRNIAIIGTRTVSKTDFTGATHQFLEVTTFDSNVDRKKGAKEVRLLSYQELDVLQAARDGEHVVAEESNVEGLDQDDVQAAE